MIGKLSPLQLALASMQRHRETARAAAPASATRKGAEASASVARTLEQRVRQRVAHLDANGPGTRQRVLRAFVEASLVCEFGERLEADPSFHKLVDQVVDAMAAEPSLQVEFDRVVDEVVGNALPK